MDKSCEQQRIPNLASKHIALWECIRNLTQNNDSSFYAFIRNDLRTVGLDFEKPLVVV